MCGRFTLDIDERFYPRFRLSGNVIAQLQSWQPRYNIAPNQESLVILPGTKNLPAGQELNQVHSMRWGLVPFWAKDEKIGYKMLNAKAETLFEKPAFRQAIKFRRCIIPATGFYEWQVVEKGKQPYYIHAQSQKYLAFAGLYEIWQPPNSVNNDKKLETFTIITTQPNQDMQGIHDRMPLAFNNEDMEATWLREDAKEADIQEILKTIPGIKLANFMVSKQVNSPTIDSPTLIEQI